MNKLGPDGEGLSAACLSEICRAKKTGTVTWKKQIQLGLDYKKWAWIKAEMECYLNVKHCHVVCPYAFRSEIRRRLNLKELESDRNKENR